MKNINMTKKDRKSISFTEWLILLALLLLQDSPYARAFTHWVVTEEGKIEAQVSYENYIELLYHQ